MAVVETKRWPCAIWQSNQAHNATCRSQLQSRTAVNSVKINTVHMKILNIASIDPFDLFQYKNLPLSLKCTSTWWGAVTPEAWACHGCARRIGVARTLKTVANAWNRACVRSAGLAYDKGGVWLEKRQHTYIMRTVFRSPMMSSDAEANSKTIIIIITSGHPLMTSLTTTFCYGSRKWENECRIPTPPDTRHTASAHNVETHWWMRKVGSGFKLGIFKCFLEQSLELELGTGMWGHCSKQARRI